MKEKQRKGEDRRGKKRKGNVRIRRDETTLGKKTGKQ